MYYPQIPPIPYERQRQEKHFLLPELLLLHMRNKSIRVPILVHTLHGLVKGTAMEIHSKFLKESAGEIDVIRDIDELVPENVFSGRRENDKFL